MTKYDIGILSDVENNEMVAEIKLDNKDIYITEPFEEEGTLYIEVYPQKKQNVAKFKLEEFLSVIEEAKKRLTAKSQV
jgi:hypothetical protein